ncbi:MAG: hypothetical protein F9K23_15805 [Bacteroidetes bacterium]|nr:MAG: hypothetical protein F9K23_15805 [Bacteroidota bacterium]
MNSSAIKDIGIGLFFLLGGITAANYFKKKRDEVTPGTDANQEVNLKAIAVDTKQLTQDPFQYKNIADQIYNEVSKRTYILVFYTYNSQKLFGLLEGLNTDELKQVAKDFGVRAWRFLDVINMPDAGTIFEWFEMVLTKEHLARMKQIWLPTGLWKVSNDLKSKFNTEYYKAWIAASLDKEAPEKLTLGKSVYSLRTGKENLGFSDAGYWDVNSYTQKAGTGKYDMFVRPASASAPWGTITGVSKRNGKANLVKIKITQDGIYSTNVQAVKGREIWVFASRLTLNPYSPPSMNGMGIVSEVRPTQTVSNLL